MRSFSGMWDRVLMIFFAPIYAFLSIRRICLVFILAFTFFSSCPSLSQATESLQIAVAANFMIPYKEIAASFREETKMNIEATYASIGNLYSQIVNGAPYDVFLSADEATPRQLFDKGVSEKPFVYATGRVVLWGTGKEICGTKDWKEPLRNKGVRKIAIANPVTAPYGAAAETALKKIGLWEMIQERLVVAQNVGQSFQYAMIGGTDGCFCALSSALSDPGSMGCHYLIEEAPPIRQAACLLVRTAHKNDASRFLLFLNSRKASEIKKRYGYF
jgi:molybdate transport system substrate-binding protein